jgi:hypothetical protein
MEPYQVRLTISADSEVETRLLAHLGTKRRASMANECRDLLQMGVGSPVPATRLSAGASRAKKALKFELSPTHDLAVLTGLAGVAARDHPRWLRETLLAGFVQHLERENASMSRAARASNAISSTEPSSNEASASKAPASTKKDRPAPALVDVELPLDNEGGTNSEGAAPGQFGRPSRADWAEALGEPPTAATSDGYERSASGDIIRSDLLDLLGGAKP